MPRSSSEIPKQMKAAAIDRYGGPEVIHTITVPVPQIGATEILIQVDVAGVGRWDPALVHGSWGDGRHKFPRIFGSDGAGTVVATGSRVKKFNLGDRVYGWGFGNPKGGFFAEFAAVKESDAALIPKHISTEAAGVLAVDGITALEGLEQLEVRDGQTIMIFGASGGIGHLALQLARRMNARVFAVASGEDGVALCRRLGAEAVVDGKKEGGVLPAAREFSTHGYDAALVLAGGLGWNQELRLVKKGGRIAFPHGVEPEPKPRQGVRVRGFDGVNTPEAFNRLNALIGDAPFHIELGKIYRLDEAAQALRDVQGHHLGKLALRIH